MIQRGFDLCPGLYGGLTPICSPHREPVRGIFDHQANAETAEDELGSSQISYHFFQKSASTLTVPRRITAHPIETVRGWLCRSDDVSVFYFVPVVNKNPTNVS